MKTAALLLRCSTDSQDYDRQLRDLIPSAEYYGFNVPEEFVFGQYITGKDNVRERDRESIRNLKSACSAGKIDAIFINEVSRLSRDSIAGRLFIREFNNDYKIPIFFRDLQQWTIDIITKKKNEYLEQMLGFHFDAAANELKSMKTRFASGKRKNARTGKIIGGVPALGYTKDINGVIIIDDSTVELVKTIFNKYLEANSSIPSVARYMRGISSLRTWGIGSISNILKNNAYTGEFEVNITDPDRDNMVESFITKIPQIINNELFEAVKAKLETNRSNIDYTRKKVHILQKLIKCNICGSNYTPRSNNSSKTYTYCCISKHNGIECDSTISINEIKFDTIIWKLVKNEYMILQNLGEEERREKVAIEESHIKSLNEEIIAINNVIDILNRKLKKLVDLYLDEMIDASVYSERKINIDSEIDKSNQRLEQIKTAISVSKSNIEQYVSTEFTNEYLEKMESDPAKMKDFIRQNIQSINPYKENSTNVIIEVLGNKKSYTLLYNPRSRKNKCYYISSDLACWQNGIFKYDTIDSGDYFYLPMASFLIQDDDEEEPLIDAILNYDEMLNICKSNNYIIEY